MLDEEFNIHDYIKHGTRFVTRRGGVASNGSIVQDEEPAPIQKLKALLAIRESSEFDYGLFEGMIEQVLQPICKEYPELQTLRTHGSSVLRPDADGERLRKHLGAEPLYGKEDSSSKPTAWAINIGKCRVIYALASAGKTDSSGLENSWVNVLAEEIRTNIPTHLFTGPFSRLIRNKDVSTQLKIALRRTSTRVHCSESRDGFRVTDETGEMLWDAFVNAAHTEWISTLTRLQTGIIFHTKQGKWPRGGPLPVIGYKRLTDSAGGPSFIVPDENQREIVRVIIETAASGMTEKEAVEKMSLAGVRSRKPRGTGVTQPLLSELGDPKSAARTIWQHLPTYLSGNYTYMQNNTVPGASGVFGVPVHRVNQEDQGHFEFNFPFGIPEGGWHDEETIKLAIKRRLSVRQKSGGKKDPNQKIKPLTGLGSWIVGGKEFRLMADDNTYQLRSRIHQPTESGVFKGFGYYEGDLVGRFTVVGLHRIVANLLRDVVFEVRDEVKCFHVPEPQPTELHDLLQRVEQANEKASRLRDFAGNTSNVEEQAAYRAQASEQFGLARSLLQQHTDLLRNQERKVAFADTDQLLATAELLERCSGGGSPTLRRALHRFIGNLQIHAINSEPIAEVTLTAVVRTDFGAVTLGPVTRSILNTAGTKRIKPNPDMVSERNVRLAYDLLTSLEGTPIREMLQLHGRAERRRLLAVLQSLLPNPYATSALLDCPIPEVQRVVLNEIFSEFGYTPLALPDGLDPLWVQEIAAIYLAPTWDWNKKSWASGDATWARQLVSWVHRYYGDDTGVVVATARKQLGLSEPQIYSLLSTDIYKYKSIMRSCSTPIEYVALYKKYTRSEEPRRFRITLCPHCGTRELPHILRVPELPDGFICSKCCRSPSSKIVYPASYLKPWVGPNQGQRKIKTLEQDRAQAPAGSRLLTFRVPPQQVKKR